ncbi:UNVERIFIED_CONTAM: hypothetical protein K2H54_023331 [Gekko kuhli]
MCLCPASAYHEGTMMAVDSKAIHMIGRWVGHWVCLDPLCHQLLLKRGAIPKTLHKGGSISSKLLSHSEAMALPGRNPKEWTSLHFAYLVLPRLTFFRVTSKPFRDSNNAALAAGCRP